jgi:hypothetical protein
MAGLAKHAKTTDKSTHRTIPWILEKLILRIMVEQDIDWDLACINLANQFNPDELKKMVEKRAESLGKSRFMIALNTSRDGIKAQTILETVKRIRETEDNYSVPCPKCGKPMHFTSRQSNYFTQIRPILYRAFAGWAHTICPE